MLSITSIPVEALASTNDQLGTWSLRQYCNLLQRSLCFSLSPSTSLANAQRSILLASLIYQSAIFHKFASTLLRDALAGIPTSIQFYRLRAKDEASDSQVLDEALSRVFCEDRVPISPQSSALLVTELALQCEVESLEPLKVSSFLLT